MKKKSDSKKKERQDAKNLKCTVCGSDKGLIHKYGLNICRRCFREVASSIGFKKLS